MTQATLQFNSIFELWRFKTQVQPLSIVVLAAEKLLVCELSEREILLACRRYAAKIIKG
jgi:hypothetical protein